MEARANSEDKQISENKEEEKTKKVPQKPPKNPKKKEKKTVFIDSMLDFEYHLSSPYHFRESRKFEDRGLKTQGYIPVLAKIIDLGIYKLLSSKISSKSVMTASLLDCQYTQIKQKDMEINKSAFKYRMLFMLV
jgi:hypothetical protein